ncbi:hypothetical protein M0D21_16935 [Aquimarina sp. D1M17]|uniref:hypothetical protein n=1 Tax=Aquimarina acroporae TaxID=2937283 RepID=UPI0020C16DEB|nr:hypothetical protein [Aquimarina acroporae]MCK8523268.1 hypothetical protein [Aquimarina acroporae]
MKYLFIIGIVFLSIAGCNSKEKKSTTGELLLSKPVPEDTPAPFLPELVDHNAMVHKGIFSNDLSEYYYTTSKKDFTQFNTYMVKKSNGRWSSPLPAFFNSTYNDHGMSFSPDGNTLYFSSTRPTDIDSIPNTWHLWKAKKVNDQWGESSYISIPNLNDKLVSHPSITKDGTLYFHVSNLDYSDMAIYSSQYIDGKFQKATKLNFGLTNKAGFCTPYVSPDHDYLVFAKVGTSLTLYISYRTEGLWSPPIELPKAINTGGQGNPYITPNGEFLFYTQRDTTNTWHINWVATRSFINTKKTSHE